MLLKTPIPVLLVLIAVLGGSVQTAYAQVHPDPCPDSRGGDGRCPGDVDAGDVIGSVIVGGLVAGVSKAVTAGQLSAGPDAAVGLRFQRDFPVHEASRYFVGLGLRALPPSGSSTDADWNGLNARPHFEVSAGHMFRLSRLVDGPSRLRRVGVGVELNMLVGADDQVQVALAPHYDVLSDKRRALFVGLYVRQQVVGASAASGPSFGITVGMSRIGGR